MRRNCSGNVRHPLLPLLFGQSFIIRWNAEEVTEILHKEKDLENLQRHELATCRRILKLAVPHQCKGRKACTHLFAVMGDGETIDIESHLKRVQGHGALRLLSATSMMRIQCILLEALSNKYTCTPHLVGDPVFPLVVNSSILVSANNQPSFCPLKWSRLNLFSSGIWSQEPDVTSSQGLST